MYKKIFITLTIGSILSLLITKLSAQNIVAFQGGEGTAADNWAFLPITNAGGPLPPGIVSSALARTGTKCIRAAGGNNTGCSSGLNCISGGNALGCPAHGKIIQFDTVNVACLSNVQLTCYHRSHTFCSGDGFDSGERLFFEVSLNAGPWTLAGMLGGNSDYTWTYATNPAGAGGLTVPNPFVYNVPIGTNTFAFRVRAQNDRSDEVFYLDDIKLTTTTNGYNFGGTAGLWNGIVNTDWTNRCNWDNRYVPTISTDVLIPNAAANICEILPTLTGNCRNIVIDKSKLAAEYFTSTLNVTGNLTIDNNGQLDLSLLGNDGGTLNLSGNWLNKRDETFFD
ncbi:MAG: hypothetical protein ABI855_19910, partial [Bacteroidota bacterium]